MKIVEVNAIYGTKSTGTIIAGIGAEFKKAGHTVYYATPNAPEGEQFFCFGSSFDRRCHALLCRIFGKQGYFSHIETYKFLRWLDKTKPDILIFVESLEKKFRYAARLSFSTKITDYLKNGKCVFAIGDKDIAPIDYFNRYDSAVTASSYDEIEEKLNYLISNPQKIAEYSKKAFDCAYSHHNEKDLAELFKDTLTSAQL